jgi:hypothetical protein
MCRIILLALNVVRDGKFVGEPDKPNIKTGIPRILESLEYGQ